MAENYYSELVIEQVREAADLQGTIEDHVHLSGAGASLKGDCPACGAKKKLHYTKSKNIFKCFACGRGGTDSISFLIEMMEYKFTEAIELLATKHAIELTIKTKFTQRERKKRGMTFRDQQLHSSGIAEKAQILLVQQDANTSIEIDRYQAATIDQYWNITSGDDMILHYYGLDGQPTTYVSEKGKVKPYIRVRWQFPATKISRSGDEMKYQSPYKSGNHLWIPNAIITKYRSAGAIKTLVIIEGEKKADKLAMHGIDAVGIPGIHNFDTTGDMVAQLQALITTCNVENVVFLLDGDLYNITAKSGNSVDSRPKAFASAVIKFRRYFTSYQNDGIYIDCYFGYHRENKYKGIDDMMAGQFLGKEQRLAEDLHHALVDRNGEGEFLTLHKITTATDYKIQEYWKLHNKTAFFEHHKDLLLELRYFKYNGIKHRVNEDLEIELDEKLMPNEEYWREKVHTTRGGKEYSIIEFNYVNAMLFLSNRGFGLYEHRKMDHLYIHIQGKIVHEVNPVYIQHYVRDFTRELGKAPVLEMLYRGMRQYLGDSSLTNMTSKTPDFPTPERDAQYLYFKSTYWKITAQGITTGALTELPFHIWADKVLDFDPTPISEPLFQIVKSPAGHYKINSSSDYDNSDIAKFIERASMFYWEKFHRIDSGVGIVERDTPEKIDPQDLIDHYSHIISKMLSIGYVMHEYNDFANLKAIVAVDGIETEVGKAEGGTGKSIFCTMFKHIIPTHIIDGKSHSLTTDQFIYDGVNERTQAVVFDDCRVNLDFEFFFSQITNGITVNSKGEKKFKVGPKKMLFTTNNMINGEGNSFERRQYTIAFSNYYNSYRTPKDDLGRILFLEWDHEQWNLFYHYIAASTMAWLKYGFTMTIPKDNIVRRRVRQYIGEDFLEWADLFWDSSGEHRNNEVALSMCYNDFITAYPQQRKYINTRNFKRKVAEYCGYKGYDFNPQRHTFTDQRIRKNGKEYLCVADDQYDPVGFSTKQIG